MTPGEVYVRWRRSSRVGERPVSSLLNLPEIELQARWFAGQFSRELQTITGDPVKIIHLGVWNREPGPDFCEAVIQIGDESPKRGSIELDTHRKDWETHGHATNPAFNDVVLHLFVEPGNGEFFTRTEQNKFVPQIQLELDCENVPAATPPLAMPGRCSSPLATIAEDLRTDLIEAAAHFRLQQKSAAFTRLATACSWDEALFQMLAVALGYKENKLPFQLLAQRITLKRLREKPEVADSLVFGCAGFLTATSLREFPPETQQYLRSLWENWWALRTNWERFVLPRTAWKLTGTRPANHPQRRLAALGLLAAHWREVADLPQLRSSPDRNHPRLLAASLLERTLHHQFPQIGHGHRASRTQPGAGNVRQRSRSCRLARAAGRVAQARRDSSAAGESQIENRARPTLRQRRKRPWKYRPPAARRPADLRRLLPAGSDRLLPLPVSGKGPHVGKNEWSPISLSARLTRCRRLSACSCR
jgi:hypothetical protein